MYLLKRVYQLYKLDCGKGHANDTAVSLPLRQLLVRRLVLRLSSCTLSVFSPLTSSDCDFMVLFGTPNPNKARGVCEGPFYASKIENCNNITLQKIFFNLCKGCQIEIMASIPPSAFSASRIRETQRNMKISNTDKGAESKKFFTDTFMELSPLKYNSKLMNSIWGLYNRYSPHNVKKVNDGLLHNSELQQSAANSNIKTEPMISLPSTKLDNVWAAINFTPSH